MNRTGLAVVVLASLSLAAQVALAFAPDREVDDALVAFRKAYASREESARIDAVETLASVQHKRVADALAVPVAKDPSPAVRRAAATALGGQWSTAAVPALAHALDPDHQPRDVCAAIIAALGRTESDAAVAPLVALLEVRNKFADQDEDKVALTLAALEALGKLGSARATEDLVEFVSRQGRIQHLAAHAKLGPEPLLKAAMNALAAITGERLTSAPQWRVWWSENKRTLREIPVFRCAETGRTFDRPDSRTKCPDQHPSCARFMKTRFEHGGLGAPDVPEKQKRVKKS